MVWNLWHEGVNSCTHYETDRELVLCQFIQCYRWKAAVVNYGMFLFNDSEYAKPLVSQTAGHVG